MSDDEQVWSTLPSTEEVAGAPKYDKVQPACPKCGAQSYELWPQGDTDLVRCDGCGFVYREPAE